MALSNTNKWKYTLYTTAILYLVDRLDVDYVSKLVIFTLILRGVMGV